MKPVPRLRPRFWVESVLATVAAVLGLVTVWWRDWIEIVFRVDPDHHSGGFEWAIVGALLIVAVVSVALAAFEWRIRPAPVAT